MFREVKTGQLVEEFFLIC